MLAHRFGGKFVPHPTPSSFALYRRCSCGEDATGEALFGPISDEPSGDLSFNLATLVIDQERSEIRLIIRIPVLADKDALVAHVCKNYAASYRLGLEGFDYLAPLYVPLDDPLVSSLMAVYQGRTVIRYQLCLLVVRHLRGQWEIVNRFWGSFPRCRTDRAPSQ